MVSLMDLLPTALELFDLPAAEGLQGRSLVRLLRGEQAAVRDAIHGTHTSQKVGWAYPVRSVRTERWKYLRNFRSELRFDCSAFGRTSTWKSWMVEAERSPELGARMHGLQWRPPEQLFDLESDPWEMNDLAEDPAHAPRLERERERLHAWLASLGDPILEEW
jgi:uncharacterized sulfatase